MPLGKIRKSNERKRKVATGQVRAEKWVHRDEAAQLKAHATQLRRVRSKGVNHG